jgi:hypothetical protein
VAYAALVPPGSKSHREVRDQLNTSLVQEMLLLERLLTPRELRIDYRWQANRDRVAALFGLLRRHYARRTRHSPSWQPTPALYVRQEQRS